MTPAEILIIRAEIGGAEGESRDDALAEAELLLTPLSDVARAESLLSRLRETRAAIAD